MEIRIKQFFCYVKENANIFLFRKHIHDDNGLGLENILQKMNSKVNNAGMTIRAISSFIIQRNYGRFWMERRSLGE